MTRPVGAAPDQSWAERTPKPYGSPAARGDARARRRARRTRRGSVDWLRDAWTATAGIGVGSAIVGAMLIGSSALMLLTSVVGLAVSVLSPMAGLLVLAFVAPLPRPTVVPPPGIWLVMVGAIVVGLIIRLPIERPRLRPPSREVVLGFAFLVYLGAHVVGGALDGEAASSGRSLASQLQRHTDLGTGLLVFAVATVVLRGRSPWPLVTALLASAGVAASSALLPAAGIEGLFDNVLHPNYADVEDRSAGFFFDPNYYAAFLAAAVALALSCASFVRSKLTRTLLVAAAAGFSLTLVLTLSRGGLVALTVALVSVAFMRSRRAGLIATMTLGLLFVLAFPFFSDARFGEETGLVEAGLSGQLAASGRTDIWIDGLGMFSSSPLFGIGFGQFAEESASGLVAHNWFIGVLTEGGVVGLALWAMFIASILLALRRTSRRAQTVGYSVLASWLVASMFLDLPAFYRPTGLVMLTVAAALTADWSPRGSSPSAAEPGTPAADGSAPSRRRIAGSQARRARGHV